jgi:hypothetical protein
LRGIHVRLRGIHDQNFRKSTNAIESRCKVVSDDFACVVYTGCVGAIEAERVIKSGVIAVAEQETVLAMETVIIETDDLILVIDTKGKSATDT